MKTSFLALTVLGLSLVAGLARAQSFPTTAPEFQGPPVVSLTANERFGNKGQLVLTGAMDVNFTYDSIKVPGGGNSVSTTDINALPSLDYFVAQDVSLGGFFGVQYSKVDSGVHPSTLAFLVGPQIGVNIQASPRASLYPRLGVGYRRSTDKQDSTLGGSDKIDTDSVRVFLFAPIMAHLAPHFFVGFGPMLSIDLVSKAKVDGKSSDGVKHRIFGVQLEVGGWK